jgi:acid phosphatase family membrane protein YuiD
MTEFTLSIFISWALVNILKPIITLVKKDQLTKSTFITSGGMPSAHTSLVVSLSSALFLETGFSLLFYIGLILSLIVIYDALHVRSVVEEHSKVLNRLLKERGENPELEERVGHTPADVLVSMVISIIIPVVIYTVLRR